MKQDSTHAALDRLQRNARLRWIGGVALLFGLLILAMTLMSNRPDTEFRFVEVVGSQFQAHENGPRWRIEVKSNGHTHQFTTGTRPGPLRKGAYICVNVVASSEFSVSSLGNVPDGICNKNGVFAPNG